MSSPITDVAAPATSELSTAAEAGNGKIPIGAAQPSTEDLAAIEYKVYPIRWYCMFSMMCLGTSFSLAWNTFSPVSNVAAAYYETSVQTISWFALMIYITSVVTGLFSAYIIDTRGMRISLIIGATFNVVGSWVRYFGTFAADKHTALILGMFGQTIIGCGRPFSSNSTTRLASTFFGMKERTLANTLGSVSPSFGVIISSAATSYIISEPSHVPLALLIWACYSCVPFVLVLFVPEKPPTPPSPSATVMASTRTASLSKWKTSIKTAFTNPSYILLWTLMSGNLSLFFVYIVLISSIMLPYGYSAQQVGFVTVTIVATGWLSLPVARIIDKTNGWVPALRGLLIVCTVALIGLTLCLRPNLYWGILLCAAVFGFSNFPLLGIVFELAMECTYPDLLPAMSSYFIFSLAQLISIILTPILGNIPNKPVVLWVLVGVSAFTTVEAFIYRGKAKRVAHETTVLEAKQVEKALKKIQVEGGALGEEVVEESVGGVPLTPINEATEVLGNNGTVKAADSGVTASQQ